MVEVPLTGWKEIATFLGSSVRTVQRFELELGLPIHRTQVSKGAVVRAYPSELTKWLHDRPLTQASEAPAPNPGARDRQIGPQRGRRMRRVLAFGTVALLFGLGGLWGRHFSGVRGAPTTRNAGAAIGGGTSKAPAEGSQAGRVSLTIRSGLAPALRLAGPDGGRMYINLGPDLDLSLRPSVRDHQLVVNVDRRLSRGGELQPVGTIHLTLGQPERLEVSGVSLEITWNAPRPPSQQ